MSNQIIIASLDRLGVASVLARKDVVSEALFKRLSADGPICLRDAPYTFLGVGPGHWLAVQESRPPNFVVALRDRLGDAVRVVDQSGAYRVFKIAGTKSRVLLQRGIPIDLHPDAFGPDTTASTSIAHMTVVLWRLEGPDAFAVAIFRSYEASFRHWIRQAVAAL